MKHYSIKHDTKAFKAYAMHQGVDLDQFGMGGRETAEAMFPRATQAQKNRAWRKFLKICAEQDLF